MNADTERRAARFTPEYEAELRCYVKEVCADDSGTISYDYATLLAVIDTLPT